MDVLEYLPKNYLPYPKIHYLFQQLAAGVKVKASQNPPDGLWYQVLDAYIDPANYPESSGSGMMVYALQNGVNLRLLDKSFQQVAEKGWAALKKNIPVYRYGGPQINSAAPSMGSQVDLCSVRPVSVPASQGESHLHGYIGIFMATSVMDK